MNNRPRAAAGLALLAGAGLACSGALAATAVAGALRRTRRLQNKVVLITGGSRGLGLALAEEFGRRGAKLAIAARDADELERARAALSKRLGRKASRDIFVFPADLRKPDEAEQLIQQTTAHFGRIDILVNNAGVITVGPIENQNVQDFRDVMDSNFFSGLHCTLSVLPQMLARRAGTIVNITSIGGKIAVPHMLPYTASKFAAVGFSEGITAELRGKGVRVVTVCPGLMRTGSHLNALFTGDAPGEYRWFSMGAGLPLVSTSARAAARKIVCATIAGKSEIAITPQAILAARLADLSPEMTTAAMGLMNLVLPSPAAEQGPSRRGAEVRSLEVTPAVALGHAAARRYNQRA
jgi:short-subunit dehydrogenase